MDFWKKEEKKIKKKRKIKREKKQCLVEKDGNNGQPNIICSLRILRPHPSLLPDTEGQWIMNYQSALWYALTTSTVFLGTVRLSHP